MMTKASATPMTAPWMATFARARVALRTTTTNTAVMMISVRKAPPPDACSSERLPYPFAPSPILGLM